MYAIKAKTPNQLSTPLSPTFDTAITDSLKAKKSPVKTLNKIVKSLRSEIQ